MSGFEISFVISVHSRKASSTPQGYVKYAKQRSCLYDVHEQQAQDFGTEVSMPFCMKH